jgi:hypothetical protein
MAENEEQKAIRVLMIVSRKSTHWPSAWTATEEVMSTAIENLEGSHFMQGRGDGLPMRLLVKHK